MTRRAGKRVPRAGGLGTPERFRINPAGKREAMAGERSGGLVRCACLAWLMLLFAPPAEAHEVRPAIVTIALHDAGPFAIDIKANLEALIAGIGPQHKDTDDAPGAATYNGLRRLPPDELEARFRDFSAAWLTGIALRVGDQRIPLTLSRVDIPPIGNTALPRIATVELAGAMPVGAQSFTWAYDSGFGSSVLRTRDASGKLVAVGWLTDGAVSPAVPATGAKAQEPSKTFLDYIGLGFTHIVPKGLDHILFVLGLYFLSPGLRPLLTQVTAFTLAHSLTLGLGLYGVIAVSPAIVEPLIAASIVYVAVENLATSRLMPWRPLVVFGFGLLHGLGFAGVLHEIGLPRADYILGLVGFNLGVEGGQLTVVALAWATTGLWFSNRAWFRHRIARPASCCIALVGAYWTIERVFLS